MPIAWMVCLKRTYLIFCFPFYVLLLSCFFSATIYATVVRLYEPERFIGGRTGTAECSIILGAPHKLNCKVAIRAMESDWINPRGSANPVKTQYLTEAAMFSEPNMLFNMFDEPQLVVPRIYSARKPLMNAD